MRRLEDRIRAAASRGKVVFSIHADNRLQERRITRWQVVDGVSDGEVIQAHPGAMPNPKILVRERLADDTMVLAVWSYLESLKCAKLVTVYFEESP